MRRHGGFLHDERIHEEGPRHFVAWLGQKARQVQVVYHRHSFLFPEFSSLDSVRDKNFAGPVSQCRLVVVIESGFCG